MTSPHPFDLLTPEERRIVATALDCLTGSWAADGERQMLRHYRRPGGRDAAAARRLLAQLSTPARSNRPSRPTLPTP
jgi:hypothetical protein